MSVKGADQSGSSLLSISEEFWTDYDADKRIMETALMCLNRYSLDDRREMTSTLKQYRRHLRVRSHEDSVSDEELEKIRVARHLAKVLLKRLKPHERLIPIDQHPRDQLSYLKKVLWEIGVVNESVARLEFPTLSDEVLKEELDLCRKLEIELRPYLFNLDKETNRYKAASDLQRSIRRRIPLILAEMTVRNREGRSRSNSH